MAYVKHDPISHILLRPDMYVGTKQFKTEEDYVYENGKIVKRQVTYSPALNRCFGEILSNAVDNAERGGMTKIVVDIDEISCSVWNDGSVIPIEINETEKMYNHSLIFGQLLSGSNYDDSEKRFTSGRNGLGAKLTNVFSSVFTVEGVDTTRHLKFVQTWKNNMKTVGKPSVTKSSLKTGYTKISFSIDLHQFELNKIPVDTIALFSRQVFDAAMTTGMKVVLNGCNISCTIDSYWILLRNVTVPIYKFETKETKIVVTPAILGFETISFVNGIRTKGGKHVDAAVEAVCRPVLSKVGGKLTIRELKPLLALLVVSRIPNPEFDSQEKSILEAPPIKIPPIPIAAVAKILKMTTADGRSVQDRLKSFSEEKDVKSLSKTTAAKSLAIDGYDKANYASTSKASECTLIVCEGLSAKTFAVTGIEKGLYGKSGRNYFGIYPLRGKLLNTRNASTDLIARNTVIVNLVKILGLDFSRPTNLSKLAYGRMCILTDADVDGIHIEGLLLNFIHSLFPVLLGRSFVVSMKTPILKIASRFYYDEQSIGDTKGKVKYYKGLGTTKPEDVKDVFGVKMLEFYKDANTDETFKIAFDKTMTAERKKWVSDYDPKEKRTTLDDITDPKFSITTLLNTQVVKFFYEDCMRTLPSVYDGLKESQRKVLYAAKKRNLIHDVKVAQFGAYVAEHTGYHHGEINLFGTIIKMAQSFVGSNNIPLFAEEGMFGTRLSGGEDAASPRYIYTKMTPECIALFPDSDVYESKICEGDHIEPHFYVPILPLLLINGCVGIASGWMCSCPSFRPEQVITNARRAINRELTLPMRPWYKNFTGTVVDVCPGKYETCGVYRKEGNTIIITELPIGTWNDKFKLSCEQDDTILSVKDLSTPTSPHYELSVGENFNEKAFAKKMRTSINVNNIVAINSANRIIRLSVDDVFRLWADERISRYEIRKNRLLKELEAEMNRLKTRIKFIKMVKSKKIDLTHPEIAILQKLKDANIEDESLLNLSIKQLSSEKRAECERKLEKITSEYDKLQKQSVSSMWEEDLLKLHL